MNNSDVKKNNPWLADSFRNLIKRYREKANMTQRELAEKAELSQQQLSKIEKGKSNSPSLSTMSKILEALGIYDIEGLNGSMKLLEEEIKGINKRKYDRYSLIEREHTLEISEAENVFKYMKLIDVCANGMKIMGGYFNKGAVLKVRLKIKVDDESSFILTKNAIVVECKEENDGIVTRLEFDGWNNKSLDEQLSIINLNGVQLSAKNAISGYKSNSIDKALSMNER